MNDLEFFGIISMFVAGFVLLLYLFTIRKKIAQAAYIMKVQAKATIHSMTEPDVDPWAGQPYRDLARSTRPAELNKPIETNIVPWGIDTRRG